MDKTTSCYNVGVFCEHFFAKERRKTLKGKSDRNLQVGFFTVCKTGAACDVSTTSFYNHIIV